MSSYLQYVPYWYVVVSVVNFSTSRIFCFDSAGVWDPTTLSLDKEQLNQPSLLQHHFQLSNQLILDTRRANCIHTTTRIFAMGRNLLHEFVNHNRRRSDLVVLVLVAGKV